MERTCIIFLFEKLYFVNFFWLEFKIFFELGLFGLGLSFKNSERICIAKYGSPLISDSLDSFLSSFTWDYSENQRNFSNTN